MTALPFLAADIGNSRIKLGLFRADGSLANGQLMDQWQFSSQLSSEGLKKALAHSGLATYGVCLQGFIVCSVVPELTEALIQAVNPYLNSPNRQWVLQAGSGHPQAFLPKHFCIQPNGYPLEQLGADRLVNLCAVRQQFPNRTVLVADFGTATTLDVLSAQGVYLGGLITPGYESFNSVLAQKTAALPTQHALQAALKTLPKTVLGQNTADCLHAGLALGYRGAIKELVRQVIWTLEAQQEAGLMPTGLWLVATGGLAQTVQDLCGPEPLFDTLEPMLTLNGLARLYLDACREI